MKILGMVKICCVFILASQIVFASDDLNHAKHFSASTHSDDSEELPLRHHHLHESHFGTSSFSANDPFFWYTIETNSYPETTPLSQNQNGGNTQGNIFLSPTGFTIGEAGNYWVSITAVLQNPSEEEAVLIPIFLVADENFDPDDSSLIGGIVGLEPEAFGTAQGTGTIKDVAAGTRFSLVATNAGYPDPITITVVSWSISLHKLP